MSEYPAPYVGTDGTDQAIEALDHRSRRTMVALAPRQLVRLLAGQIQAEALDRGRQMDLNKAEVNARMVLALPGIGRAIFDAYYGGTGCIVRVNDRFEAIAPERILVEAPDERDRNDPVWRRALDLFPGLRHRRG